jgi:DEAD/DEAH box helicase domain-containing protein
VSGRDAFPDVPLPFPPYLHQEQAFQRLCGSPGRSTIIATGTGSGKTECFLYPLLDYCWHKRGEPGIKAIVIYPLNALATDQAKRFARVIYDNARLRSTVRVGLYIGAQDGYTGNMVMTADQVITHRDTMRLQPPDILLTNYKMLDYLMIRPADVSIWKDNGAETLKYIIVDELHTFDGAQGTDLACLLRRLKARLKVPQGHLRCVGTSATLGGLENTERLREYASQIFGEPFDAEAIVGESVLQPQEFFGESLIDMNLRVPVPEQADDLQAEHFADIQAYLRRQAELWFDLEGQDVDASAWRMALGERLLAHVFFRNLIVLLHRRLYTMDELVTEIGRVVRGADRVDRRYWSDLLVSMLALISTALVESPDGGAPRPFLQVRLQLWMRELRRLVCSVGPVPVIRFADGMPVQA